MNGVIRDACAADFARILALNEASVHFLSPLDRPKLERLHGAAAYHRVVDCGGTVAAFLLAFREDAPYDSPNFVWFQSRYPKFLYVDRIVVSAAARGAGFGILLYDDLLRFARAAQIEIVTCEFDIDPPNPASAKFHERFGFREVGRQRIGDGKKEVSLQVRPV